MLGGIQLSAIDHEAKIAAATAVKKLTEVTAVTGAACQHVQLIDILSVKKQVKLITFMHAYDVFYSNYFNPINARRDVYFTSFTSSFCNFCLIWQPHRAVSFDPINAAG